MFSEIPIKKLQPLAVDLGLDKYPVEYRGFDLSAKAVELAIQRTGQPGLLFIGDASSKDCYVSDYDCIVCTEVLEHLQNDLEVIALWKPSTLCICSVPNFDAPSHERFFGSPAEVEGRYGSLIHIQRITEVRHPGFADISLRNYCKQLYWNLGDPKRMLRLLGLMLKLRSSKSKWYVFVGEKR